jgi:hypothetical protein
MGYSVVADEITNRRVLRHPPVHHGRYPHQPPIRQKYWPRMRAARFNVARPVALLILTRQLMPLYAPV